MCMGGGPSIPAAPPAANPATIASPQVAGTAMAARSKAAAAAASMGGTNLTNNALTAPPTTAGKDLLG